MKKTLLAILLGLCGAIPLCAQSTTVSVTVVDQTAQAWANGTISYTFSPTPGIPGPFYWGGAVVPEQYMTPTIVALDGSGSASFSVPTNTAITPSSSGWLYNVCPNASAKCVQLIIPAAGSTQNISAAVTAVLNALQVNAANLPKAYSDSEVVTVPAQGGTYYNVLGQAIRYFNGSVWATLGGGSGMTYPPSGIPDSTGTMWSSSYDSGNPIPASIAPGTITAVTGTAPVVVTPSGSTVNVSMQDSTVTPGTYLNVAFTVSAKGLITAAGPPFSASFGCTQCGTYEIGYSGITAASGAISYANPSVPTSASVSDGTNTDTLSTPFTSWVLSHTYTTNTTFTLTTLGNGQTVTQSNGIAFVPRSYGGTGSGGATGATASGTSAALVGASGTLTNIGLGTSCAGQSFTATTSGTQYIYYLSPCNVSNPGGGSFTIPGPTVFPMNAPTSFTFTGQYGGTWSGYLYQSVNSYVSGTNYTIGVGN